MEREPTYEQDSKPHEIPAVRVRVRLPDLNLVRRQYANHADEEERRLLLDQNPELEDDIPFNHDIAISLESEDGEPLLSDVSSYGVVHIDEEEQLIVLATSIAESFPDEQDKFDALFDPEGNSEPISDEEFVVLVAPFSTCGLPELEIGAVAAALQCTGEYAITEDRTLFNRGIGRSETQEIEPSIDKYLDAAKTVLHNPDEAE